MGHHGNGQGETIVNGTGKRPRLMEILRTESIKRGHFVLASGRTSDYYLDCRRTTLHAEGACLVGELVLAALDRRGWNVAAVGGLTLGADPMATAAAIASHHAGRPVHAFLVRKETKAHGTGQRIERAPAAGTRVALVEDVITTGGSSLIAYDACREAGLEVAGLVALVDREEGGRAELESRGIQVEALFTARELLG
ncbi:MAG: orotate phosphoribosyltransferase [Acidobacteria bacterium]|nr:orotate phosphoribosyltransferase [Acidobacteriota bacterium]